MRQAPHGPEDLDCPLHQKPMSEVCHRCGLWMQLKGPDAFGNEIDEWRCSFNIQAVATFKAAQESRQAAASCDKAATELALFRESMERANAISLALQAGDRGMQETRMINGPDSSK